MAIDRPLPVGERRLASEASAAIRPRQLSLLSAACAAILPLLLCPSPASASPRVVSLVYTAAPNNPQEIGAAAFRKELTARIGDHLVLDVRRSVTVGSENAILTAVQSGAADISLLTGPIVTPAVPAFGIFDVPFLFRDTAHVKAIAEGPIGETIAAKFPEKGLVLLGVGEQGFRHISNSKRPIHTPADLKGLKIRVLPNDIYTMTFTALGAEVVPMEYPLVYPALKDGRIDGQENPVSTMANARLQEVQKYLSLTGHFYASIAFVMNAETYDQMDAADRVALVEAAKVGAEATRALGAAAVAKNIETLKKGGMEVAETVDRPAFVAAIAALEPEFEKRFGKELLAAIRATH
jgi:tripartite ATP-independent transporter DctP family solute receptor